MRRDRHVRLDELLIGIEGLALLRNLYDGSDEDAGARLSEVRAILNGHGHGHGHGRADGDGDGDGDHARDPAS
jgi:hypothetical protein